MVSSIHQAESAHDAIDQDASRIADALRVHFDRSPHGTVVTTGERHVARYANPAFRALAGPGGELVLDRPIADAPIWRSDGRLVATLDRVYRTGDTVRDEEFDDVSASRTDRRWSISAWAVSGLAGRMGLVIELRDITTAARERDKRGESDERIEQLREINERLLLAALREEELTRRAEAASDAKSTFLAMMSHELRTPLTAIIGYEELLADGVTGDVSDEQRAQLGRIKTNALHLLALIDEILTLSRVEAGREVMKPEPIEVADLLEEVRTIVLPLCDARRLKFGIEAPDGALTFVSDVLKVRQILVNLLSNAFRFTEHGEVVLTARRETGMTVFDVRDTGAGILPEHLDAIFDPFWQVEQKMSRRSAGSGLGLAVSRRLARFLGGDVTVESIIGRGSRFTLRLPIQSRAGTTASGNGA
jgi:signal transduction histidine kinase